MATDPTREAAERLQDELRRSDWDMGTVLELFASALATAREEGRAWQPIETAPKDGSYVLLRVVDYRLPMVGHWFEPMGNCAGFWEAYAVERKATHWMPIPAAPAGVATTEGGTSDGK